MVFMNNIPIHTQITDYLPILFALKMGKLLIVSILSTILPI